MTSKRNPKLVCSYPTGSQLALLQFIAGLFLLMLKAVFSVWCCKPPNQRVCERIMPWLHLIYAISDIRTACHELNWQCKKKPHQNWVDYLLQDYFLGRRVKQSLIYPAVSEGPSSAPHNGDSGWFWVQQKRPGWTWSLCCGVQRKAQKGKSTNGSRGICFLFSC